MRNEADTRKGKKREGKRLRKERKAIMVKMMMHDRFLNNRGWGGGGIRHREAMERDRHKTDMKELKTVQ